MLLLKYGYRKFLSNANHFDCRSFSCTRYCLSTYYDILKINQKSSQDEIRAAYIRLCKENHPDKNKKDESLHNKFLRINEAYKVLSKPETRRKYDDSIGYLEENQRIRSAIYRHDMDMHDHNRPWNDQSFAHNRTDLNKDACDENNYYGIRGVKKVSNNVLLLILLCLVLFSGMCQIITVKMSLMSQESKRVTQENAQILSNIKALVASRTEEENLAEIERSYHENLKSIQSSYRNTPK